MTRSEDAPSGATSDEMHTDRDVDVRQAVPQRCAAPPQPGSPWPRLHPDIMAIVFVGGCVGGYARYAITTARTSGQHGLPWSTFTVNVSGAFILALVIVLASDIRPSRYLRPLLGTGFCGALTTMSTLVVTTDQLIAYGHPATAATYVGATTVAALTATAAGLTVGRALASRIPDSPHGDQ